jgi:hypothetical protein
VQANKAKLSLGHYVKQLHSQMDQLKQKTAASAGECPTYSTCTIMLKILDFSQPLSKLSVSGPRSCCEQRGTDVSFWIASKLSVSGLRPCCEQRWDGCVNLDCYRRASEGAQVAAAERFFSRDVPLVAILPSPTPSRGVSELAVLQLHSRA